MSTQKGTLINKYTPNYVIFDLETTGISPNYDEVIEISALKVKGGEVVDEFNTLVNPGRKIPFGATKVNGITNAMVAEAPAFSHVLEEFLDFAEGLVLVGHNIARFDMKFIWRDAEQYFGEIPQNNYVDTLQVARKHLPKMEHHRLVDLAEHYGISSEGAHRALNDCYMNQKVYECMVAEMREAHQKRVEEARKKASEDVEVQQRPQHFTVKIRGVVERITYQNPENGYTVLKCAVKSYKELVTVIGSLLDVNVGSVLLIYGNWKVDSRYGRQFAAESWEETLPATVFGIEKYLGSGLIKGVGPKYAKKIVAQFGIETLEVIETDISRLQEVDGIGKKRIQMIRDSWERQKEIKNVMLFLQDHGVSTSFAAKIYRQYGNESLDKMKENPFQMADDIWGIGFKTADGIAQKLGFAKEAYVRLRSGIMYTLSNLADEGHVFAYQEQLIAKAAELLEAEESSIVMTLDQMIADKDLICETVDYKTDQAEMKAIYLPAFYYAEAGVAGKLKRLAQAPAADRLWHALMDARQKTGNESLSIDVGKIQEKVHMEYDEIQTDAIRKAAVSKVMVLTGGPGTGKTTTTQGIIAAYRSFGLKILLAAPTGRAAKRMTEATGLEAKTIHRLLECKPPEGYQKNEDNPLDGDVLIIDECSMIDMILMNALLKAIPEGMRLILVGDIDQLPSVGAGNVLRDIIDSGVFPVVRLTRIFRQAQSSRIIMNAHAINEGKFPDISNGKNTDFFYIEKEDPEEAVQEIVRLVKNNLPRYYKTPWNHIQVLTPMQKGIVGAANLNLALQEALNPQGDGLRRGGYLFRTGDKVMQIRNNYEKEIFNGDIGTVESVDLQERTLKVNFDQHIIEYEASELDELVHAYATTIHKAQGSEYPIVVMPVLMNHYVMLQRNLIYTGITRAKKVLVIVGTRKALSYAVRNVTVTKRNTFLKERLSQA
jgi:exodeoxyribonuclease V alpha subunit